MGTKTGILIGVGIGYVLGTRAGRERYEQIRANASKLRRLPIVARPWMRRARRCPTSCVRAANR